MSANNPQTFAQAIQTLIAMGFDQRQSTIALQRCNGNIMQAADLLANGVDVSQMMQPTGQGNMQQNAQGAGGGVPAYPQDDALQAAIAASQQSAQQEALMRQAGVQPQGYGPTSEMEDANLQAAIAQSMNQKSTHDRNYEPIARVDQRIREKDQPTGLRNIGNTCYFNSLLQVYYTLPGFVKQILEFEVEEIAIEEEAKNNQQQPAQAPQQQQVKPDGGQDMSVLRKKLVKSGMKLIHELQILFTSMALGKKKYLDPNGVLQSVLDDQGDQVAIGEEKDISEYNSILLTRIQDAFKWKHEKKVSRVEEEKKQSEDVSMQAATEGAQADVEAENPPLLEAQSSFSEADNLAAAFRTQPAGAAKFDSQDLMEVDEEEESKQERDVFEVMFSSRIKNLVEFIDKKQIPQRRTSVETQHDIILYIQDEEDFYQAWENVVRSDVPDYQNDEDGERYKASQTTWIGEMPEILTFQMQRTAFVDGIMMKKQHKHPIPPVIFPDRFQYKNRVEVESLRKNVDTLRKKIQFLKECLAQYTNFNGSEMPLLAALEQALSFFKNQGKGQMPETTLASADMADINPHLPLRQEPIESNLIQLALDAQREKVQNQIKSLQDQIAYQESLLNNQYSSLQKMPYHLHGVCIHDGTAESGHYYSFIKDHCQGVWRKYDDHRVTVVEQEQVLEEAMGGGLTKSAYYVIYISEKELHGTKGYNQNSYEPHEQNFEKRHAYGKIANQAILNKIMEDNRKLVAEVDEFKGTEIAKKVTTLYEKCYQEIMDIINQKVNNKDIGSIYTYLLSKQETADLGKRLLLDQCFFVETKQRVQQMERSMSIVQKIDEKARDKKSWYPGGRMWMGDDDWNQTHLCVKDFQEKHMIFLNQSLAFEKLVEGSFRDGLAVMNYHIRKNLVDFQSEQLTLNTKSPHKMFYDSIRILGLRISAQLNKSLIQLHQSPDDENLKTAVVQNLICLCQNTTLLKQSDKHLTANKNHLAYSITSFAELIERTNLKPDFDVAMNYILQVSQQVYPASPVVVSNFSREKDFTFTLTDELQAKVTEHQNRVNEFQDWKVSDADLIHQFAKNFGDFKTLMNTFIKWHIKVIQSPTPGAIFNEMFELQLGINVQEKKYIEPQSAPNK